MSNLLSSEYKHVLSCIFESMSLEASLPKDNEKAEHEYFLISDQIYIKLELFIYVLLCNEVL